MLSKKLKNFQVVVSNIFYFYILRPREFLFLFDLDASIKRTGLNFLWRVSPEFEGDWDREKKDDLKKTCGKFDMQVLGA